MSYNYTAIIRTKRHYNFQTDYISIEAFDKDMEKEKNRIVWAVLLHASNGDIIKKIDGDYV